MESNVDNKIASAIRILAGKVNELFARKDHRHTRENLGIQLSNVAFSGSYRDLKYKPEIERVSNATSTQPGIVTSGKGTTIGENASINVLVDSSTGLGVDTETGVTLNMGSGMIKQNGVWNSSLIVRGAGWKDLADKLGEVVSECFTRGVCTGMNVAIVNMSSNIDTFMNVKLTNEILNYYNNIRNYVKNAIINMNISDYDGLSIPVCCTGFDEIFNYEFLKIISETNTYDAVILGIFKNASEMSRVDMMKCLGMIIPDTVSVVEYSPQRFGKVGLEAATSNTLATTYVLKGNTYSPLRKIITDLYSRT